MKFHQKRKVKVHFRVSTWAIGYQTKRVTGRQTDPRGGGSPQKDMFTISSVDKLRSFNSKLFVYEHGGPRSNFFATRAICEWNKLDNSVRAAKTVNEFKSGLRRLWASKPNKFQYDF